MDVVGLRLTDAIKHFEENRISYSVEISRPYSRAFSVDESQLYVIRQRPNAEHGFCLLAAAKMGKEVF